MEPTDRDLLTAFRERRCERSFRQLVTRHAAMVFATARRITSDSHRAEEISQGVFVLLAQKAGEIAAAQPLAGWLYHTTRHRALDFVRSEARRQRREQLAVDMQTPEPSPSPNPLTFDLEAALAGLQPAERDVLVLRFLEDRQLRDVGGELGISEQAAQKRVERALDRLREVFASRGVSLTSGALIAFLAGEASAAVPASLIATATTAAVAGTGTIAALSVTQGASTTMNLFNLKTAVAILGAAAVTGTTTYFVQERGAERLRVDHRVVSENLEDEANARRRAEARIQLGDEQIAALKQEVADLPRLRGEVDRLNRMLERMMSLESENVRLLAEVERQKSALNRVSMGADHSVDSETDAETKIYHEAYRGMLLVQGAFEQYRLENKGAWPSGLGQLEKYLSHGPPDPKGGLDRRYVLFHYPGVSSSDLPPDAVLITELDPRRTNAGKHYQAYFLADGSVQVTEGLNQMRRGPKDTLVLVRDTPRTQ